MKIILCSKIAWTKFIEFKCFDMKLHLECEGGTEEEEEQEKKKATFSQELGQH